MDDQDIALLTKHIDLLMEARNVDALLNELLERNVLSEYIANQLRMIPNEKIRLKTLFEELKSRGPAAFEHLLSSLVYTGNEEICNKLNETKNPSSEYSKIKVIKAETPLDDDDDGSSVKIYRMRSSPRGYALIINNHDFFEPIKYSDEETRHGSYRDVANLYTLFSQLGYKVRMHYNLTKKEIHDKVSSFASMPEHASVDSTVVVVMSHGGRFNDTFRSFDNLPVHCDTDIVAHFTHHKSEHLHGKPKIFIFQICRGNQNDHGKLVEKTAPSTTQDIAKKSTSDATGSSTFGKTSLSNVVEAGLSTVDVTGLSAVDRTSSDAFCWATGNSTTSDAFCWATGNSTTSSDVGRFGLPNYDEPVDQLQPSGRQPQSTETREARINNIFKIYSTTYDYESIRDCVKGSHFVDNMCQIFAAHAHRLELRDLLYETAKVVTKIYDQRYGYMTPSITYSGDCLKLYFNPGIYDETTVVNHQDSDRNYGNYGGGNSSNNGDRINGSDINHGTCREDTERNDSNRNNGNCSEHSERNVSKDGDRINDSDREIANSSEHSGRNCSNNGDRINDSNRNNGNCRQDDERNCSNNSEENTSLPNDENVANHIDSKNENLSEFRAMKNSSYDDAIFENTSFPNNSNINTRNNSDYDEVIDYRDMNCDDAIFDNTSFPNNSNRYTRSDSECNETIDTSSRLLNKNGALCEETIHKNCCIPRNLNRNGGSKSKDVHKREDERCFGDVDIFGRNGNGVNVFENENYSIFENIDPSDDFSGNLSKNVHNIDGGLDATFNTIDGNGDNVFENGNYSIFENIDSSGDFSGNLSDNVHNIDGGLDATVNTIDGNGDNVFENGNYSLFENTDPSGDFSGNLSDNVHNIDGGLDATVNTIDGNGDNVFENGNYSLFENIDSSGNFSGNLSDGGVKVDNGNIGKQSLEAHVFKNVVIEDSSKNDNISENINMNFEFCDRGNRAININKTSRGLDTISTSSEDSKSLANVEDFENRAEVDENGSKRCAIIKSSPKNSEGSVEKQKGVDEVDNNKCKSVINDCIGSEKSSEDINSQKGRVANDLQIEGEIAVNEISVLVINEDVKESCETNSTFYVPCDDQFLVNNLGKTDNKVESCAKRKNWGVRKFFRKTEENVGENDEETSCFDKSKCDLL